MVRRVLACCVVLAGGRAIAQTPGNPYIGYSFATGRIEDSGYIPPDTMGAVGVNQFAQFINGYTGIWNKDGTRTYSSRDTTFWNTTAGLTGLTPGGDSRVLYDTAQQRWVSLAFTTGNGNSILLGRTDGPDALGPWRSTSFTLIAGTFGDYPTLGMNGDSIAVATNNFNGAANNTVSIYSLPKSSLYTAAGVTPTTTNLTRFPGLSKNTYGYLLTPATNYDAAATGTLPVMSPSNTSFSQMDRTTLSGTGAAGATFSTKTTIAINTYSGPPSTVSQPGTTSKIESSDDRFSGSVVQIGNRLFMVNSVNNPAATTFAAIRFTVINATTNAVIFQTNLTDTNTNYIFPSVGVNAAGDVVIGMTAVLPGPSTFYGALPASAAAIVGAETSPGTWTFNPRPTILQAGVGAYSTDFGSGRIRWGDYSATTPDPADPGVFWTNQEFAVAANASFSTGRWGTQASEVIVPKTAEARWQPGTAGSRLFTDSANWYAGTAPAATDHVIFSRWTSAANSQTVTTATDITADRLSVRQTGAGTLTLSLAPGTTFTASNTGATTPSLAVAEYQGQARLAVTGGGTLSTQTAVVAGATGATGVLTIDGAGTTWANAGAAYIGGTAAAAGGQGTLALTNGATANLAGPLVAYNSSTPALRNVVTVGTAGAAATLTAAGLANAGVQNTLPAVTLANAGSTLALNPSGTSTFTGVVSGPGSLTVGGTGTQQLGGANTYTGATTVTAGTLALQGSGSFAASPTVSVAAGATLDATLLGSGASYGSSTAKLAVAAGQTLTGSGTVSGGLTAAAGSTVRPVGALTVSAGSAVFQTGSTLSVRVTDASAPSSTPGGSTVGALPAPTSNGFLNVSGAGNSLTLNDTLTVVIDGTGAAFTQYSPYSYTVAQASAVPAVGIGHTFAAVGFQLDPASTSLTTDGSLVYLNFTPVPEPATVLLIAAGGLGAWRLRRRA